jgi:ATP-dependent Clp protease ATP-binding subunit ClpA
MRQVIWVATSNIGAELVAEHDASRMEPDASLTRPEYVGLMGQTRQQASERLGVSTLLDLPCGSEANRGAQAALVSRVTAVLPFVPFGVAERTAIAAEALLTLGGELVREMEVGALRAAACRALDGYIPNEGARSLYRAVSTLLMDEL